MAYNDPVRVPKAGELVAAQLRRQIVRGELLEGASLPSEAVLMERFGVSRPTLREAFRILEAENLISVRRGARGGARVHVPEPASLARQAGAILQHRGTRLNDVYATRTVLETQAAGLLANTITPAKLDRLEELLALEEAAVVEGRIEDFTAADQAVHLGVVELAGSRTLDLLVRMLYAVIETAIASSSRSRPTSGDALTLRRRTHRSHTRLLEILRDGSPAEAEAYWNRHLTSVSDFLLEDIPAETVVDLMS